MTPADEPDKPPPPVDWRSVIIEVGKRVLYHHDGSPRLGYVEGMKHSPKIGWQLKVRWTEDPTFHRAHRPLASVGAHLNVSAQIRPLSVTVWPEDTCTHTSTPAPTPTTSGGTGAPPRPALASGSPSAATGS